MPTRTPPLTTCVGLAKQGAIEGAPGRGVSRPTEGSAWIVEQARRDDPRPLWVLVWGGLEDVAQALHDAPDILPKLRVYFIGGPNKMWSVDAYDYIEQHHPTLWMIEANSTYRGWFVGGTQSGTWGNRAFVATHVAGRGALGDYFATLLNGTIKMGDSPSVGYLLRNTLDDPSRPGWGGQFVPVWEGRKTVFERLTTASDVADAFGVVEFVLPVPAGMASHQTARMIVDGRIPVVGQHEGRVLRFRFSPRDAKVWPYVIESDVAALDGLAGRFSAVAPSVERTRRRSTRHPQWWTDTQDPSAAEGIHAGARTVSQWREALPWRFRGARASCGAQALTPSDRPTSRQPGSQSASFQRTPRLPRAKSRGEASQLEMSNARLEPVSRRDHRQHAACRAGELPVHGPGAGWS